MSTENKSPKLVQVTSVDALMKNGSRIAWQSFRPAAAEPDTKPTVYITTLTSNTEMGETTIYDLDEIGAQAVTYGVELTLTSSGPVTLEMADGSTITLTAENPSHPLPPRGKDRAILLSFDALTCSLEARPDWPKPLKIESGMMRAGDGEGGDGPPPPFPGGGNQNDN
ncbi:hypothetical protein [Synoicihabitans lomoniglobus]|uniref:Uncharacterized protein n=1 Tax=Synoicihabitans lomoniglobus TaxID=2909285 RepID=A0AAE9ZWD4_9BACT|nr:hypothetical protein [Opitutaceae bacterium LMO-M01]WED64631.1 hypothetical protein PXH66_19995 [Opitutaceae bacterium LMO-M01]